MQEIEIILTILVEVLPHPPPCSYWIGAATRWSRNCASSRHTPSGDSYIIHKYTLVDKILEYHDMTIHFGINTHFGFSFSTNIHRLFILDFINVVKTILPIYPQGLKLMSFYYLHVLRLLSKWPELLDKEYQDIISKYFALKDQNLDNRSQPCFPLSDSKSELVNQARHLLQSCSFSLVQPRLQDNVHDV